MLNRTKTTLSLFILIVLMLGCDPSEATPPPTLPAVAPEATATINPIALQSVEIPEQLDLQGEAFNSLNLYDFLRFRKSTAELMTWNTAGSEHIAATISNGIITVNPIDQTWFGSETIQVEACEPTGACATQSIVYTVMDKTAYSGARVTFVGNSGFLITVGDKKVLIDAFFAGFPPGYTLPEGEQDLLVNAQPPFDDIDLILATHAHDDHFSAAMIRQHMQNNPNAVFVSTTQAVSQLAEFGDRVIAVDPVDGAPINVEANGIQVEAIYLSHGYPPDDPNEIFNNAYVVNVNGIKFFHTGDLDDLRDVAQYNLSEMNIDLAFIQHFYLQNGMFRSVLENDIGAKYLFPIHYQFTTPEFDANNIKTNYPDAVIFYGELGNWFMPEAEK
jgi:L-ascorbate metabolism protein UlaG (beta-lactamase superfamily)